MSESYNGWANYETWNVALWIQNDEGMYDCARIMRRVRNPYQSFANAMRECGFRKTPDGVEYNNPDIDIEAIDEMIREL
jgi:hypothetical protein